MPNKPLGHRNGYINREVLHGDISDGNTFFLIEDFKPESAVPSPPDHAREDWTPLRHGMTGDWGSAADCRNAGEKERLRRTVSLYILSGK